MSPTLNGSSAIWHFEGSDTIEICNGITFDFYTGLPHIHITCRWKSQIILLHTSIMVLCCMAKSRAACQDMNSMHMSPTLSRSSVICFKHSDATGICDRLISTRECYTYVASPPHVYLTSVMWLMLTHSPSFLFCYHLLTSEMILCPSRTVGTLWVQLSLVPRPHPARVSLAV